MHSVGKGKIGFETDHETQGSDMVVAGLKATEQRTELAVHSVKTNLSRGGQAGQVTEIGGCTKGVAGMAAKVKTLPGIAHKEGWAGCHVGG
jgi:hypothetical protein